MTISATVTAYQALHATVTGVTSAPTELPASLDHERLPLVFTWPGPSVEDGGWQAFGGGGGYKQSRYYVVRCYVAEVADSDADIDDGYQLALPILQAFGVAYMASANLNLGGAVAHIGPLITDTGIAVLEYAGIRYTGFEYRIQTVEKV